MERQKRTQSIDSDDGGRFVFETPPTDDLLNAIFSKDRARSKNIFDRTIDSSYAINRAVEKSQAYGDLLMLVSAAEAKQTVRMLRNVFIRVFNIVLTLYKNVQKLNVPATIDLVTDIWLEMRYGWTPFIGEMTGIHEALTVVRPTGIKAAYGTHKQSDSLVKRVRIPSVKVESGYNVCTLHAFVDKFDDMTAKAGFNYVNKPGSRNDSWAAIFGVDQASLLSTTWELVPWSFIVDMFLNLGNILQARDVTDQVSSFNGYLTRRLSGSLRLKFLSVESKPQATFLESVETLTQVEVDLLNACMAKWDQSQSELSAVHNDPDMPESSFRWTYSWDKTYPRRMSHAAITNGYMGPYDGVEVAVGVFDNPLMINMGGINNAIEWYWKDILGNTDEGYSLKSGLLTKIRESEALRMSLWRTYFEPVKGADLLHQWDRCIDFIKQYPDYSMSWNASVRQDFYYDNPDCRRFLAMAKDHLRRNTNLGLYGHVRRYRSLTCSDPKTLKKFNQRIDIQLLDRKLLDDFSHQFTADVDLNSAQIADLTAFAWKLGRFFQDLK
jgi:hypothetical protein